MATETKLSLTEEVAARLANNRANRNGGPDIVNVLDILPDHLKAEVMGDAEDVLKIVGKHYAEHISNR